MIRLKFKVNKIRLIMLFAFIISLLLIIILINKPSIIVKNNSLTIGKLTKADAG